MLGPLMLGIAGTELLGEERERLCHPAVGGVLLFARNYRDPAQLAGLTEAIRGLRNPPLLIAVDQEGGRVQRFRAGLTELPAAERLARSYASAPSLAQEAAQRAGWLMAMELRALGVDLSFAPVLDLDHGISQVIGDRALGADAQTVATLGLAWQRGAREAGMACVGKHFPGHGGTAPDSHEASARDPRSVTDLEHQDLLPFRRLIDNGLAGVMMAHVAYPAMEDCPAGFSPRWIQYLRETLRFEGSIFSDDLEMAGAAGAGSLQARVQAALQAGCDMAVLGNAAREADAILAEVSGHSSGRGLRLARLHGRGGEPLATLQARADYQAARELLAAL
ncbi:beta-N-acetylhexosaminidase [Spiribacter salinus]|nr:beta-N-acetylhexosaminidase [Spiribacter salinus]MBY5268163.1 beta-N-acetylhexosaminidase [Spiribacter salinus]